MNSSDLESHTPSKKSNSLTLDNIHQEEGGIAAEHQQSGIYGLTRKLMSFVVPANQSQTKEMSANVLESGLAGVSGRAEYPQAVPAGYMSPQAPSRNISAAEMNRRRMSMPVGVIATPHGLLPQPSAPQMPQVVAASSSPINPTMLGSGSSASLEAAQLSAPPSLSVSHESLDQHGSPILSPAPIMNAYHVIKEDPHLYRSLCASPSLDDTVEYDDEDVVVNMQAKSEYQNQAPTNNEIEGQIGDQQANAQPPTFPVPVKNNMMAEFDPLIPQDWMMRFDSPKAGKPMPAVANTPSAQPKGPLNRPSISATPPQSLLDGMHDVVTPMSIVRYTERDMALMKYKVQKQADEEIGVLQSELQNIEVKCRESERARVEMKAIVEDFEKTMGRMIEDSRQEKERHEIVLGKMNDERQRTQNELKTVENAFKDLRVRYEEQKQTLDQYRNNEAALNETIEALRKDVVSSEKRVDALRTHAEKKLAEANAEVNKLRQHNETELTLLKAKLQKSELRIKNLEQTVQQKESENAELMGICDQLIQKMEKTESVVN